MTSYTHELESSAEMLEAQEHRLGSDTMQAMQAMRMLLTMFETFVTHTEPPRESIPQLEVVFCASGMTTILKYIRLLHPEITNEGIQAEYTIFHKALERVHKAIEKDLK